MFKYCNLIIRICLFFVICSFLFSSQVSAVSRSFPAPEVNGPTGLVRIPSADVIPYKNYNVYGSYGQIMRSGGGTGEGIVGYAMNLGTFHGVEIGVIGGTDQNTNKPREGVFVNMKLSLSTGEEPYPLLLALGVENLFSYTQSDVYMVATKYFQQGPKLTFGFMADFPQNKFRPLGITGIDFGLGDNLFILGDLMAGENLFQVNAGVRFYFTPTVALSINGLNVLDGGQVKDQRTGMIGLSWANPF